MLVITKRLHPNILFSAKKQQKEAVQNAFFWHISRQRGSAFLSANTINRATNFSIQFTVRFGIGVVNGGMFSLEQTKKRAGDSVRGERIHWLFTLLTLCIVSLL